MQGTSASRLGRAKRVLGVLVESRKRTRTHRGRQKPKPAEALERFVTVWRLSDWAKEIQVTEARDKELRNLAMLKRERDPLYYDADIWFRSPIRTQEERHSVGARGISSPVK